MEGESRGESALTSFGVDVLRLVHGVTVSSRPRNPAPCVQGDYRAMKAKIATRDELLGFLSDAAREGHVGAMRLLLEELRRDGQNPSEEADFIDELARKRKKTVRIG